MNGCFKSQLKRQGGFKPTLKEKISDGDFEEGIIETISHKPPTQDVETTHLPAASVCFMSPQKGQSQ